MRVFLPTLGIAATEFKLEDGSGLSRLDLVTPNALTRLLTAMAKYEDFALTLPVGGFDGSLERRYTGFAGAGRIRAKTGGLTGVQTIAGYIDSPTRGKLAFAILMNNDVNGGASARAVMDEITLLFAR
jgi:D-alanyl-D-alanine carboxypeptidase/D-alanyl-D-alanine-endopeptidase (penicillin-binding protein 4)